MLPMHTLQGSNLATIMNSIRDELTCKQILKISLESLTNREQLKKDQQQEIIAH